MLTQFQNDDRVFQMMQNSWATELNPLLTNTSLKSIILPNVVLVTGSNMVNHRLGRKLQGWRIIRQRSAASFYDTQDSNQSPQLTLVLVSSTSVSIDLEVF